MAAVVQFWTDKDQLYYHHIDDINICKNLNTALIYPTTEYFLGFIRKGELNCFINFIKTQIQDQLIQANCHPNQIKC